MDRRREAAAPRRRHSENGRAAAGGSVFGVRFDLTHEPVRQGAAEGDCGNGLQRRPTNCDMESLAPADRFKRAVGSSNGRPAEVRVALVGMKPGNRRARRRSAGARYRIRFKKGAVLPTRRLNVPGAPGKLRWSSDDEILARRP